MTTEEIIQKTDSIRKENYLNEPPIDVYELAKNNGLDIVEIDFPAAQNQIAGFVTIKDGANKLYVNLSDSPNRRNFTVAHELGHWILHRDELETNPNRSVLFRIAIGKLNTDPLERQANIFAANLLVPLELLEKYRDKETIDQLAARFGVSKDVIGYRLELLEKGDDVRPEKAPEA